MPAERSSHPLFSLELSDYVDDSLGTVDDAQHLIDDDAAWEVRRAAFADPLNGEHPTGLEAAATARNGWS